MVLSYSWQKAIYISFLSFSSSKPEKKNVKPKEHEKNTDLNVQHFQVPFGPKIFIFSLLSRFYSISIHEKKEEKAFFPALNKRAKYWRNSPEKKNHSSSVLNNLFNKILVYIHN